MSILYHIIFFFCLILAQKKWDREENFSDQEFLAINEKEEDR